ncbi:Uncharacterised protein [Mycobacteroides abscessus]|nr:Uncharacterised protein [Mycobacteroides abscessus]
MRPLTFQVPVPGTRRTRATASLRRPRAWPGAVMLWPRPVGAADSEV